ncbi:hypothetical protein [Bradyrhizobium sp. LTSP857]|uniref:hypothetical protein n=1 Tax=Bradyrhizobium sp. LTSP857 TaxID=1619231 RepID=UPI0005D2D259|nr:hypothetical protein [Bradyrhizobium sp. LTSP857]KJC40283.1 hypothetical protein UP06_26655 [Bradyrhizobium sp. LTSP857]
MEDDKTFGVFIYSWLSCVGPCRGLRSGGSQRGVLFDHIPEGVVAPVIVEVTIISREPDTSAPDNTPLAVMNARVERVVKGRLDSDALKSLPILVLVPELA